MLKCLLPPASQCLPSQGHVRTPPLAEAAFSKHPEAKRRGKAAIYCCGVPSRRRNHSFFVISKKSTQKSSDRFPWKRRCFYCLGGACISLRFCTRNCFSSNLQSKINNLLPSSPFIVSIVWVRQPHHPKKTGLPACQLACPSPVGALWRAHPPAASSRLPDLVLIKGKITCMPEFIAYNMPPTAARQAGSQAGRETSNGESPPKGEKQSQFQIAPCMLGLPLV